MNDEQIPAEYKKYKSEDPFSDIQPALLNSADIADYVDATRMVVPFDRKKLKPASYEVPFSGEVYWWDAENKERRIQEIRSKDDTFILRSNAIVYVHPDTTFFLPDYIAMRFNLRITHVHQGLLLGTGPLVDPGFCGRLLIPLHNMTSNEYPLVFGNGLIWVEFTKLSAWRGMRASVPPLPRKGEYVSFITDKRFLLPDFYFRQAQQNNPFIISSIPYAIADTRAAATRAVKEAEAAKKDAGNAAQSADAARVEAANARFRFDRNFLLGFLALAIAVTGLLYTAIQIFQNTLDSKTRSSEEAIRIQIESFQKELNRMKEGLDKAARSSKAGAAQMSPEKPSLKK